MACRFMGEFTGMQKRNGPTAIRRARIRPHVIMTNQYAPRIIFLHILRRADGFPAIENAAFLFSMSIRLKMRSTRILQA
jgi:hypothetical protein